MALKPLRIGAVIAACAVVVGLPVSAGAATDRGAGPARTAGTYRTVSPAGQVSGRIRQPRPPITARAFPVEPLGRAPRDNDGRIPNPATPTGARIGPPTRCSVRFAAAAGATSALVNAWIAGHENRIRHRTVVCLAGVFRGPIRVWGKANRRLLELAPAPGATATVRLGRVRASDTNPNQFWSDSGGVSIVDSRSVEIYGLAIEDYTWNGLGHSPAGIYVTTRSDVSRTDQKIVPHESACFAGRNSCGDIYIIKNTVRRISNSGDENFHNKALCGNGNVDAYGIAVIAAGSARSKPLQHLVIEDNTVTGTRTGQSETVTINGNVTDFLAARNVIHDADNIGLDTIGWELGSGQARHGLVTGNTVYNIDTLSNAAYGAWSHGACRPQPENAAGIYDDGAKFIWIRDNVVWDSDQGINLDVETPHKSTSHLLVSGNTVINTPGTSFADPSYGPNPPRTGGRSTVAGHDPFALYVDAFGPGAAISDVYVHDNTLRNQSQYFLQRSIAMPVVDLGGIWSRVQIWHNVIEGIGRNDRYNPLFEIDQQPTSGPNVVNCNDYARLSEAARAVHGNFALPARHFMTLTAWRAGNKHGWDADSAVGRFSARCPVRSIG